MSAIHPYADAEYAASFGRPYRPVWVPEWATHVLMRPIPGCEREDATGCYPRAALASEARLAEGLARLAAEGAVSVVLVPDALTAPSRERLEGSFARVRPFKRHYVIDRAQPLAPSKHHRYEIRKAARSCIVRRVALAEHLPEWSCLYDELIDRHGITGIQRFSSAYFRALAQRSDLVAYAAFTGSRIVAMALWLVHADCAYNHLAASNAEGYAVSASYLIYAQAIEELARAGCSILVAWRASMTMPRTASPASSAASPMPRARHGSAATSSMMLLTPASQTDKSNARSSRPIVRRRARRWRASRRPARAPSRRW